MVQQSITNDKLEDKTNTVFTTTTKPQKRPVVITKRSNNSYCSIPYNPQDIKKLGNEMINWAYDNEDVVNLDLFPLSKRMNPWRFYRVARKNPDFAECLDVARYIISTRIEAGWLNRKFEPSACKVLYPKYNKEREWMDSRIQLAAAARMQVQQDPNITVLVEPIQTSSDVPVRKLDTEEKDYRKFE